MTQSKTEPRVITIRIHTYLILTALLCLAAIAFSQSAKVIALDPADAKEAKRLADARAALLKDQADFDEKIKHKYASHVVQYPTSACISGMVVTHQDGTQVHIGPDTCTPPKPTDADQEHARDYRPLEGWEGGIQYSEDYRFIVPVPYVPPKNSWGNSCFVTNPAYTSLTQSQN